MQTKLQEIKEELWRRMHRPIPEQGEWLRQVVTGHFAYFSCPDEHPGAVGVPALCDRHLEAHASAAQSKGRLHSGSHRAGIRALAS